MHSQGVAKFYDLLSDGVHETRDEVTFVRATVQPGASILEIGAGIGSLAMTLAGDGYRVTALEPDPEMYAAMLTRLALRQDLRAKFTPVPKRIGFDLQQRFDACIALAVMRSTR